MDRLFIEFSATFPLTCHFNPLQNLSLPVKRALLNFGLDLRVALLRHFREAAHARRVLRGAQQTLAGGWGRGGTGSGGSRATGATPASGVEAGEEGRLGCTTAGWLVFSWTEKTQILNYGFSRITVEVKLELRVRKTNHDYRVMLRCHTVPHPCPLTWRPLSTWKHRRWPLT